MRNNKGMTMVEVMVAFVLIVMGLGGLYKATQFSSNLLVRADKLQEEADEMVSQYYQAEPKTDTNQSITFTDGINSWNMNVKKGTYAYTSKDGTAYELHFFGK